MRQRPDVPQKLPCLVPSWFDEDRRMSPRCSAPMRPSPLSATSSGQKVEEFTDTEKTVECQEYRDRPIACAACAELARVTEVNGDELRQLPCRGSIGFSRFAFVPSLDGATSPEERVTGVEGRRYKNDSVQNVRRRCLAGAGSVKMPRIVEKNVVEFIFCLCIFVIVNSSIGEISSLGPDIVALCPVSPPTPASRKSERRRDGGEPPAITAGFDGMKESLRRGIGGNVFTADAHRTDSWTSRTRVATR